MSDDKFYTTYKGKKGGDFEGRTFVQVPGAFATSRDALKEAGAVVKGPGAYLLPEGKEDEITIRLDKTTVADQAQSLKDRAPVEAGKAAKLEIGDMFDFGGEVGKAKITGIGTPFTPKKASSLDDRLILNQETVYVYNANAPKSAMPKPELTEEEKAQRASERAAAVAERDKTRVPAVKGSVKEGDTVKADGKDVTVAGLGRSWELADKDAVAALKERFPKAKVKVGDEVQFASFETPAKEAEKEEAPSP